MKIENGYYISAYCIIDSLGNILDVNLRHDQNISLWEVDNNKVKLVHHCEIERVSGLKHHNTPFFSTEDFNIFLNKILKKYNLTVKDIKGIFGTPGGDTINDYINNDEELSYHSLSHIFTSIFVDSNAVYNEDIIALALDAEPDVVSDINAKKKFFYSGAFSRKGQIEYFSVPSPGIFWFSARERFKMPEGTLMALAYASKSKAYKVYDHSFDIYTYSDALKADSYIKSIIEEIFSYSTSDIGKKFNCFDENFSEYDNKVSMVMKILQEISIKNVEETVKKIINKYNIDPAKTCLSLSGGYSLNCPTNTYLMQKFNFKKLLMAPCVNDSGQSIGMGLKYFFDNMERVDFELLNSYYGDEDVDLDRLVDSESIFSQFIESITDNIDLITKDLITEPIVWFNGRAEIGPRSLGHRSILADPRQLKSKDLLNKYKQREWWRPVAPIILESKCDEWFQNSFESPYMLNNFTIREEKKNQVPAILHIDDTARVQTVDEKEELLYKVVYDFYKKTGVPIICNTSLNDKGEPIINTIEQAFNFALRKNIKVIYVNGKRVQLKEHIKYIESAPIVRNEQLFLRYASDKSLVKDINKYNITGSDYYIYKSIPELSNLDIENEDDAKIILSFVRNVEKLHEAARNN